MKRLINSANAMLLVAFFGLALFVSACGGNSPEAKGKELAEKMCKCAEDKDETKQLSCLEGVMKEAEEFSKSLKSDEDKKKFDSAGEKATEECMKKLEKK